jgi:hypothetical protein
MTLSGLGTGRSMVILGGATVGAFLCSPPAVGGEQSKPARFEHQVAMVTGGRRGSDVR